MRHGGLNLPGDKFIPGRRKDYLPMIEKMSPGMDTSTPKRLLCFGADTRDMDEGLFEHRSVNSCWLFVISCRFKGPKAPQLGRKPSTFLLEIIKEEPLVEDKSRVDFSHCGKDFFFLFGILRSIL